MMAKRLGSVLAVLGWFLGGVSLLASVAGHLSSVAIIGFTLAPIVIGHMGYASWRAADNSMEAAQPTQAKHDAASPPVAPLAVHRVARSSAASTNVYQGMFRLWIVVSGLWLLGSGIGWYQYFAAEWMQISVLDECGKLFPPAIGSNYALITAADLATTARTLPTAADSLLDDVSLRVAAGQREADEAKLHPDCAPSAGAISFIDLIAMHVPDREALRQRLTDAIRASAITALAAGGAVPAGLLIIYAYLHRLSGAASIRSARLWRASRPTRATDFSLRLVSDHCATWPPRVVGLRSNAKWRPNSAPVELLDIAPPMVGDSTVSQRLGPAARYVLAGE